MGGHGTLGDHVGSGTFGFAHSAGDGLAALQMDPNLQLRGTRTGSATRPSGHRSRGASTGPGGVGRTRTDGTRGRQRRRERGDPGHSATSGFTDRSAVIIPTSDGGGSRPVSRHTSSFVTIGQLTPGTNPGNWDPVTMTNVPGRGAQLWCEALQETDLENWMTEGLSGGAYNKVIRWAFEKQGATSLRERPASRPRARRRPSTSTSTTAAAASTRSRPVHWRTSRCGTGTRLTAGSGHQNANDGVTNYLYVKVKNRGTSAAGERDRHRLPLPARSWATWPTDFAAMTPVGRPAHRKHRGQQCR